MEQVFEFLSGEFMKTVETTVPVLESQYLPEGPRFFLVALTSACQQLLESDKSSISTVLQRLVDALNGNGDVLRNTQGALVDDSLTNLMVRCCLADANVVIHDFVYMISTIALAAGVQK